MIVGWRRELSRYMTSFHGGIFASLDIQWQNTHPSLQKIIFVLRISSKKRGGGGELHTSLFVGWLIFASLDIQWQNTHPSLQKIIFVLRISSKKRGGGGEFPAGSNPRWLADLLCARLLRYFRDYPFTILSDR